MKKKVKKDKKKTERNRRERSYGDFGSGVRNSGFGAFIFKVFLITILGLILVFVIFQMLGSNLDFGKKDKKIGTTSDIDLEAIEENLHESELEGFIRQAISEGNFALAIRLYFLQAIKDLSLNKFIRWKRDKTNRDYLRELDDKEISKDFQGIANIFERVWYGQNEIGQADFKRVEPLFLDFLKKVN